MKRNIYILWATIRPKMFISTLKHWVNNSSGENNIFFKIAVNTESQKEEILKSVPQLDVRVLGSHIRGVPMASYGLTHDFEAEKDEDIVIWMSDDFFCPKDWDKIIIDEYSDGFNGCVMYKDGIQYTNGLVTMPILTYSALKTVGKIIYNPIYHHCFADNMLYDNLKSFNLIRDLRFTSDILFEHRHFTTGKRAKDEVDLFICDFYPIDEKKYIEYFHKPISEKIKPSIFYEKKLSVLIPTMERRKKYFDRIIENLTKSYDKLTDAQKEMVEVVFSSDDGSASIGAKRNDLLTRATGEYIAFVDDDDLVSEDYYSLILKALETNPDVVGIHLLMDTDDKPESECRTYHSLKYTHWYDEADPDRKGLRRYFRNPNHLNPVKRLYALYTLFPDIDHGEDRVYSQNILKFLKEEVNIEEPLYYYKVRSNKEC